MSIKNVNDGDTKVTFFVGYVEIKPNVFKMVNGSIIIGRYRGPSPCITAAPQICRRISSPTDPSVAAPRPALMLAKDEWPT